MSKICRICNAEYSRSKLHWRYYHSDISFEKFKALELGYSEVPKCKYCGSEAKISGGKVFALTCGSEECKRKLKSDVNSRNWENSEYRNKVVSGIKDWCDSEIGQKSISERSKKNWQNEEYRLKRTREISEELKERWKNEEYRAKVSRRNSEVMTERWKDPNFRKFKSEMSRKALIDGRVSPDFAFLSHSRVYIALCEREGQGLLVKIGVGNPWRRWVSIISLDSNLNLVRLIESEKVLDPLSIEKALHDKFRPNSCTVPHLKGRIYIDNEDPFDATNGSSEWFDSSIFDEAIESLSNFCEVCDSTEGFNQYLNSINVKVEINPLV